MYALKIANTSPALYVSADAGFFDKTDTITSALQLARQQDAQAMKEIIVETTEIVSV